MMKKVLVAVFIVIILGFGVVGYTQATGDSTEIVDDNSHSMTIKS